MVSAEKGKEVDSAVKDPEMEVSLAYIDIEPLPVMLPKAKPKYAPIGKHQPKPSIAGKARLHVVSLVMER